LSEIDGNVQVASGFETEFSNHNSQHTTPSTDEARYVPDLAEGDGVQHDLFGMGTVVEIDGDNATIYFKGKGTKKLNIAFAPIKKLS
jgi:hypothetical protein